MARLRPGYAVNHYGHLPIAAAPFIDKANDEWTHAIVTGDADVMAAPYAADGIFVGPDGSEVRGRDGVRAMYAKPRTAKVL